MGPLVIHSDPYLTEITWQVLINWGIFNLTFGGTPIDFWT